MSVFSQLADRVREVKQTRGPLAAVTLIVPNDAAGLDATRYLARALSDLGGVLNVTATTLRELANTLFVDAGLANGRILVTPLLREAAVRRELSEQPGIFGDLALKKATIRAVASTSQTLDEIPESILRSAQTSTLVREVIDLHLRVRRALGERSYFLDETFVAARARLADQAVAAKLGTVIFVGLNPSLLSQHETALAEQLRVSAGAVDVSASLPEANETAALIQSASIVSMTDADEEARGIARLVAERIASGVPGHRIGIFVPSDEPYRALLARHLDAAGISWAGKSARQLVDTAVARNLLALLADQGDTLDYRRVLNAMAERALLPRVKKFPTPAEAEHLYRKIAEEVEGETVALSEIEARRTARQQMFRDYVQQLTDEFEAAKHESTWLGVANALQAIIDEHFAAPQQFRPRFVNPDADDFEMPDVWRTEIDLAVASLGSLDGIAPAPTPQSVVEELESALLSRTLRHQKVGTGVLIASFNSSLMRDLDLTIICGLAEGIAPPRKFENPLLPDDAIATLGGVVPNTQQRIQRLYEQFVGALQPATGDALELIDGNTAPTAQPTIVLTYPRSNLRGGGDRVISRWISNAYPDEDSLARKERSVGSYQEGILTGSPTTGNLAATPQARSLARYRAHPELLHSAPSSSDLGASLAMRSDRRRGVFSKYNGNLSGVDTMIHVLDHVVSPTALEKYREAPMSFFIERVLGGYPLSDVVESPQLDPLTRGTMIHEILEKWITDHLDDLEAAPFETLRAQFVETAAKYRAEVGRLWVEQYWQAEQKNIENDLRFWFAQQQELLAKGWRPVAAEAHFPSRDEETLDLGAVSVELLDGNGSLVFSGQIDRIDRMPNGSIRIIDYKGGRSDGFKHISAEDPAAQGTKFQLSVYGRLAQQMVRDEGDVETTQASYWFVRTGDEDDSSQSFITIDMTNATYRELQRQLTALAHDLRAGAFPPKPSESRYDEVQKLLRKDDLERLWKRISADEALLAITDFWSAEDEEASA